MQTLSINNKYIEFIYISEVHLNILCLLYFIWLEFCLFALKYIFTCCWVLIHTWDEIFFYCCCYVVVIFSWDIYFTIFHNLPSLRTQISYLNHKQIRDIPNQHKTFNEGISQQIDTDIWCRIWGEWWQRMEHKKNQIKCKHAI